MKELKIRLIERMLGAELTAHLGYEDGKDASPGQSNRRNGTSAKVLKGRDGELPVAIPRDRDSSFEPELVKKGQTRIDGIDDRIVGLYAARLTVRDIEAHRLDLHGLKVSPDLISRVTDAMLDEVREWQSRALDRMYPIRRRGNDPPGRFLILLHHRCATVEDPRRRQPDSEKQGRLRRLGRHARWQPRGSGPVDRRERGR